LKAAGERVSATRRLLRYFDTSTPSSEVHLRHRHSRFKWRRRRAYIACLALIEIRERDLVRPERTKVFEGAYYDKSAEPRVVLAFPKEVTADQANEYREMWNDQHQGLKAAHGTSVTGGGATVTPQRLSCRPPATSDTMRPVYR
jgi:hypothetical protein